MRAIPTLADRAELEELPPVRRGRTRASLLAGTAAVMGGLFFFHLESAAHAAPAQPAKSKAVVSGPASVVPGSYLIRPGDTLSGIASRLGVSIATLTKLNGIVNADRIVAGDRLTINAQPAPVAQPVTASTAKAVKPEVKGLAELGAAPVASPGGPLPPQLASRPARLKLRPMFAQAASDHRVPLELLQAMTWHESGWQNDVVSSAKAKGIGQLTPDTVAFVNEVLLRKKLDPNRADHNIQMSAAFLRYLLNETNGDARLALASYYQGLTSVRTRGMYNETVQYVRSVLAVQKAYF